MISVDSVYNKIVASIENDLPVSVKKPVGVKYRGIMPADAKNEKTSFEEVLKNVPAKIRNIDMTNITSRIEAAIVSASAKYGIDYALIKGVIKAESDFNPNCVSHAGAMGLMQLMPENVTELGLSDPFNIEQNIDGGTRHLKEMLDRFDNNVSLALAAYNAGPGNVVKYGGIPPFNETQNYVPKVLANMDMYKNE